MARFMIPGHEGRVFKDDTWEPTYPSPSGWRSLADHGDAPARYGDMEAFAVELDGENDCSVRELFDAIRDLGSPFVAAEIVRVDGNLVAIGFYPAPEER